MNPIESIVDAFRGKRVLIIGDIMLDKYIWGKVDRISPEAPVPVVHVQRESALPGGAANVGNNVRAMGGVAIMVGVRGEDEAGSRLLDELTSRGISTEGIIIDKRRPTIQKVRLIGQNQQLLRVDYEMTDSLSAEGVKQLVQMIRTLGRSADVVVISDYAKGVVSSSVVSAAMEIGAPLIIDPKPKNKALFKGCTVLLPNYKEALQITGQEPDSETEFEGMGKSLMRSMAANIIITRGEKGMSIFNKHGSVTHMPTIAREVFDVSGAGDTVTAAVALCLAAGASLEQAATVANHAAGVVVGKVGTATASRDDILESLRRG